MEEIKVQLPEVVDKSIVKFENQLNSHLTDQELGDYERLQLVAMIIHDIISFMAPDSNRYKFIIQVLKQDPEFSNLFSSKHDSKITEDYLKFLAIACHYCVGREDLKTLLNNTIEDRSEAASILRKITSKEHQVIKEYKIEKLD